MKHFADIRLDSIVHHIDYLNVAPGGRRIISASIPVRRAFVASLPDELEAIVITSDLQGRARAPGGSPGELLGHVVVASLQELAIGGLVPPPARSLALLCGDLYTVPDLGRRGGLGPVDAVWSAFADAFAAVVGISGNHDELGGDTTLDWRMRRPVPGGTWLHGASVDVLGVRVAGVSGILGNPRKPNRVRPERYVERLRDALAARPDILLLHEDPSPPSAVGAALQTRLDDRDTGGLLAFGHRHKRWWHETLHGLGSGRLEMLSVDARVLVIQREPSDRSDDS